MYKFVLCWLFLFGTSILPNSAAKANIKQLTPDEVFYVSGQKNALGFDVKSLNIFCWSGRQKLISHYFESAILRLGIVNDEFVQYQGATPEEVLQDIENKKSLFSFNFLWSPRRDSLPLNVFNSTCVGVETAEDYKVVLQMIDYDTTKVILLGLGLLVLFISGRLSENSLFFYICGVSFGMCASFLILVYLVSKILPRKALMYGSLVCGWTLVFYFGQMMWQNFQMLAQTYREYLLYYCLVTGVLSFIICYRYGPPTDKRSKNLIKWGLQGIALVAIWCSSDLKEATLVVGLVAVSVYYSPKYSLGRLVPSWAKSKKRKLISVAEFERQGAVETAKALEDLKRFCSSPECNQWRTISRLKDPSRFASFIEGESHVMDSEIIDHETSEIQMFSEEEEENSDEAGSVMNSDDEEAAGDYLISEEDEYAERSSIRRNGSVRREVPLQRFQPSSSVKKSQIPRYSNIRTERTPVNRSSRTPVKRTSRTTISQRASRLYHLSDED